MFNTRASKNLAPSAAFNSQIFTSLFSINKLLLLNDFIINCDKIYADKVSSIEIDEKPCNLFETIAEKVEDRGNNIKDDTGLVTPYPEFNRLYGGLRPGNIYAIVSRPGQGKTTWINDICLKTSLKNNVKALILDTEMSAEEMQFRMISSISGVPMWYVETGNWRRNVEMTKKVNTTPAKRLNLRPNLQQFRYPIEDLLGTKEIIGAG